MTAPQSKLESRLAQVRERLSRATPGPWRCEHSHQGAIVWAGDYEVTSSIWDPNTIVYADGELIASAPTDLSFLLRVVDEYERALIKYAFANDIKGCLHPADLAREALAEAERLAGGGD